MRSTLITMPIAAIILAAGASRRLGEPKQLVQYQGESLLARAIRLAHESGASPVFVVLGAHFEIIRASVQFEKEVVVRNDQWEKGIASSIHAGLRALDAGGLNAHAVLIMTCDQPHLSADHLRSLIRAFGEHPVPAISASSYAGTHGIPAVFPRTVFTDLAKLSGDQGARKLLARPPCPLIEVDFPGGEIDIDLPADLAQLD